MPSVCTLTGKSSLSILKTGILALFVLHTHSMVHAVQRGGTLLLEESIDTMQAITALRAAFSGMSVQDDSSSSGVLECEVVEVKNTCPFRQQSGLTKKGKPRSSYLLRDPGPRQKVRQDAAMGHTVTHVQGSHAAPQEAIWSKRPRVSAHSASSPSRM